MSVGVETFSGMWADVAGVIEDRTIAIELAHEGGHFMFKTIHYLAPKVDARILVGRIETVGKHGFARPGR